MLHRTERTLENIPVGSLGMIPIDGCQELGGKVKRLSCKNGEKRLLPKQKMMSFSTITKKRLTSSMLRFLVLVPEKQKVLSMNR